MVKYFEISFFGQLDLIFKIQNQILDPLFISERLFKEKNFLVMQAITKHLFEFMPHSLLL